MIHSFKFLSVLFLAFTLFAISACEKDDEDPSNKVTITIEEPTNDAVISDCSDVHIHVDFSATMENHEVEVVLHPEGDTGNKIIDYGEHDHDKEITFEQEVDLCSFPAGTCFHLEVSACTDHDCAEKETADAEFCLQ